MAFDAANRIGDKMNKEGYNWRQPGEPTYKDLKNFIRFFSDEINLSPRLNQMIRDTNNRKNNLRKKIKAEGLPVYQYYSH